MIYQFGESVPESQTNLVLSTRYFVREVKRLIRSVSSQRLLPDCSRNQGKSRAIVN